MKARVLGLEKSNYTSGPIIINMACCIVVMQPVGVAFIRAYANPCSDVCLLQIEGGLPMAFLDFRDGHIHSRRLRNSLVAVVLVMAICGSRNYLIFLWRRLLIRRFTYCMARSRFAVYGTVQLLSLCLTASLSGH